MLSDIAGDHTQLLGMFCKEILEQMTVSCSCNHIVAVLQEIAGDGKADPSQCQRLTQSSKSQNIPLEAPVTIMVFAMASAVADFFRNDFLQAITLSS